MSIPVSDPFGIAGDVGMPFLARALDPHAVQRAFEGQWPRRCERPGHVELRAIRVIRYKPRRRCLIGYDVTVERPEAPTEPMTLVGKARARGLDRSTYHLIESLWKAGFGRESDDGISVPEPVGVIPEFQMWLQRQVPGRRATDVLAGPGGLLLAGRCGEAIHKLHQAGIPPSRRHTMADELRILHERLPVVAQAQPRWAMRLERLLDACDRLGAAVPEPRYRGIHRDFYPDQVLVDGPRLYLLDLDLYCDGDPALDIGNFLGHLMEQSLRTLGDPDGLADRGEALLDRFLELSNETTRHAIVAYTTLTLVRHIYLSTQFPERRQFTEALLELCEQRLGLAAWPAR